MRWIRLGWFSTAVVFFLIGYYEIGALLIAAELLFKRRPKKEVLILSFTGFKGFRHQESDWRRRILTKI